MKTENAPGYYSHMIDTIVSGETSGFVARIVIEEPIPIDASSDGMTLGQTIDKYIASAISNNTRVESFEVHISKHDWNKWTE